MAIEPEARFSCTESWRAAVHEMLANEAAEVPGDLPTEVAPPQSACPYKGLAAYLPEDARFFSGREATKRLFLRLVTPGEATPDTRRILARSEIEHDSNPVVM